MNLVEAVSMSSLVFNRSVVFGDDLATEQLRELIEIQHRCYQTFVYYRRYDLSIASLRNLLMILQ